MQSMLAPNVTVDFCAAHALKSVTTTTKQTATATATATALYH